jgi:glycosyltransferase involved in cell wall biosynthesis
MSQSASCVCCTTESRRWCLPFAIDAWRQQTLKERELIIVFDGPGTVADLVPEDPRIRLLEVNPENLGHKHNLGVDAARYPWIAKWDDDDWHAPWRLEQSIKTAEETGAGIASSSTLILHELIGERRSYEYLYQLERPWLPGQVAVWKKSLWEKFPYPDRDSGIDTVWIWNVLESGVQSVTFPDLNYILFEWGQKTGRKAWNPGPPEYLKIPSAKVMTLARDNLADRMKAFRGRDR